MKAGAGAGGVVLEVEGSEVGGEGAAGSPDRVVPEVVGAAESEGSVGAAGEPVAVSAVEAALVVDVLHHVVEEHADAVSVRFSYVWPRVRWFGASGRNGVALLKPPPGPAVQLKGPRSGWSPGRPASPAWPTSSP